MTSGPAVMGGVCSFLLPKGILTQTQETPIKGLQLVEMQQEILDRGLGLSATSKSVPNKNFSCHFVLFVSKAGEKEKHAN